MKANTTEILRNVDLNTVVRQLEAEKLRKRDMIVPADWLSMQDGIIFVGEGKENLMAQNIRSLLGNEYFSDKEQFKDVSVPLIPTESAHQHIADKTGIPQKYYNTMREGAIDLLDINVSYWFGCNGKNYLIRTFAPNTDEDVGILRALLSDRFLIIDHLDVLMATLKVIKDSGANVVIDTCDVTEKKLYVRFIAPDIVAKAPDLLKDYRLPVRSPNLSQRDEDGTIFAGFILSNSETGHGTFTLTPRVVVKVCNNGMIRQKDSLRKVHLGEKQNEGIIEWSNRTREKMYQLVIEQTRDAVQKFLSSEYLDAIVSDIRNNGHKELEYPVDAICNIADGVGLNEVEQTELLEYFSKSSDLTGFGAVQSLTYFAQTCHEPERRYELESVAVDVLEKIDTYDKPRTN